MGRWKRFLIGFAILAPLACLALLDSLSRYVEAEDPDLSVALNPYNTDARIRRSVSALNEPHDDVDEVSVAEDLAFVTRVAPVDARAYGLLGETALRAGQSEKAESLFRKALQISPTELHSLKRMIGLDLQAGNLSAALDRVGILLKRWPERFEEFADIFPAIMRTQESYPLVLAAATEGAAWRGRLLDYLSSDARTAPLAYRFLLDLREADPPLAQAQVDRAITLLFNKGRPRLAHRAFVLSRISSQPAKIGYVTNAAFEDSGASSPFDWRIPRLSGVEAEFLALGEGPRGTQGLRVRFRNKPVKGRIAEQTLMLPPGDMHLITVSSARNLETPKGLSWSLTCSGAREPLIELSVEAGRYDHKQETAGFSVPPTDCETQRLVLSTGVVAQSMRYRYDGRLIVHRIEVRKNGAS